jgi:hypothetical protein
MGRVVAKPAIARRAQALSIQGIELQRGLPV